MDIRSAVVQTGADPNPREADEVQTLKDCWEYQADPGCAERCVETVRLDGESVEAWIARHQAAVQAAQALNPPK